jgi:hypothetical protein
LGWVVILNARTMTTTHQYVEQYPIAKDSTKLILGTIHPHDHQNFELDFFYGNEGTLWKILSQSFPDKLTLPLSVKGIANFLNEHKIAISDTILECTRKNPTALDMDLNPTKLNFDLINQIRNSQIEQILFTSGFGKNNAFRLFYVDILGKRITKEIKDNRGVVLDGNILGRPIKLTVLYSPAGTANVGISKSKLYRGESHRFQNDKHPVKKFKIEYYKRMLGSSIFD